MKTVTEIYEEVVSEVKYKHLDDIITRLNKADQFGGDRGVSIFQGWIKDKNPSKDEIKYVRSMIKNESLNEAKTFMRLPGHVIGNELYMAKRHMESIYSRLTDGNDYIDKEMTTLIKLLQSIRKESKSFGNADEVPRSYTWC